MMKIVGIIVAAVLAVVVVTTIWGGDETELVDDGSGVDQLAEPPTADIGGEDEGAINPDPVEDLGEEPVPAVDQTTTEALTDEVEDETIPAPEGTEPTTIKDDVNLAEEVEEVAEEAAGTEAAGSVEGLQALDSTVFQPETFDYDAVQQAISDSELEETRKDQLTTALERANSYPAIRDSLLEDIRAELGVE